MHSLQSNVVPTEPHAAWARAALLICASVDPPTHTPTRARARHRQLLLLFHRFLSKEVILLSFSYLVEHLERPATRNQD